VLEVISNFLIEAGRATNIFYDEHRYEIYFAVLFALVFELIRRLKLLIKLLSFIQKWRWFNKTIYLPFSRFIKRKLEHRELRISAAETEKAITSSIAGINKSAIARTIYERGALKTSQKLHYSVDEIHYERSFLPVPLLDARSQLDFVEDACKKLGNVLLLQFPQIDTVCFLNKDSNDLVKDMLYQHVFLPTVPVLVLSYNEIERYAYYKEFSRDNEALDGRNILLVEATVYSPAPLVAAVNLIRERRATACAVGIVFNAIENTADLTQLLKTKVVQALTIDLKASPKAKCDLCVGARKKLKALNYKDY
jgi:hypothetical protein